MSDGNGRSPHLWPLGPVGALPKHGKTPAARRTLPITDDMLPIIDLSASNAPGDLHALDVPFAPQIPQRRHITELGKAHKRALLAAGITDRVKSDDLRHTGLDEVARGRGARSWCCESWPAIRACRRRLAT